LVTGERVTETQDVTDSAAVTETGDTPVGARRGRRKGSVNKTNRIAKQAIVEAEPHMFLIKVMKGQKFRRAGSEGGRRTVDCYPTLRESISAGETLLRKIAPDMKAQELSGPDGEPIAFAAAGRPADGEVARRAALLFLKADKSPQVDGGRDMAFPPAEPASAEPLKNENSENQNALPNGSASSAPEKNQVPDTEKIPEKNSVLVAPAVGASVAFGSGAEWLKSGKILIRHTGPQRDGLPDMCQLYRNSALLMSGRFETCMSAVAKLKINMAVVTFEEAVGPVDDYRPAYLEEDRPSKPPVVLHRRPRT
jgi:hypothetical protein